MIIYAIKHIETENMYIGQTIQNSKKRWNAHKSKLRRKHSEESKRKMSEAASKRIVSKESNV